MPRVVPSQIVAQIDNNFSSVAHQGFEVRQPGAVVILAGLLEALSPQHLALLDPRDHLLFLGACEIIAHYRAIWRTIDPRPHYTTTVVMGAEPALDNRHPLEVIRTVLARCPDDMPGVVVADLAFLAAPDLAATLRLDMSTAVSALGNGEFKAACVMAGSVIEALLLWALKRTVAVRGQASLDMALVAWTNEFKALSVHVPKGLSNPPQKLSPDWEQWKLVHMINIGRRILPTPLLTKEAADAADSAREFRNLIHPERANATPPTLGTTQVTVGAMNRAAEELEILARTGKL